jgi:hypothetical protein
MYSSKVNGDSGSGVKVMGTILPMRRDFGRQVTSTGVMSFGSDVRDEDGRRWK